jgi:hypothetical protein
MGDWVLDKVPTRVGRKTRRRGDRMARLLRATERCNELPADQSLRYLPAKHVDLLAQDQIFHFQPARD